MDPKALVKNAEALAQALVLDSRQQGLALGQLIQTVEVALRLLRATYPGTAREVFDLTQLAEATYRAMVKTSDVKH